MTARIHVLYRENPIEALEPIDEASVPDCGAAAIERLQKEAQRRTRIREFYAWPLWLTASALVLGIFTIRQQPAILVISFIVLRDVCIGFWLNSDKSRVIALAIEEVIKAHGPGRHEREKRLREAISAWNGETAACNEWLGSADHLGPRRARKLQLDIHRLRDHRRSLTAEIAALRSGSHAAP